MSQPNHALKAPSSSKTPQKGGVLTWAWPPCPSSFRVYDKYAHVEQTLSLSELEWAVPVQGRVERFRFAEGEAGMLQRKLAMLTQADSAPSTVTKFTRSLIKKWPVYVELLELGPRLARGLWETKVLDVDTAKAGKTLLKLACKVGLGDWTASHLDLARSLDTRAKRGLQAQRGKLKRREKLLPVSTQADVVRVLDEAAATEALSEKHVEGLAALALVFQHGMRPVQLLALRMEHLPPPNKDATGEIALVVSFHAGKKQTDDPSEMLRQVKPEWVSLVNRLRLAAVHAGRARLFSCTSNEALWAKVTKACKEFGLHIDFKAYGLRHTSVQSLADAGHDRKSIQGFLGHSNLNAATTYLRASRQQGQLVNKALGASKLYENIVALSKDSFISVRQLIDADEEQQVGGVVGGRLVAGIGICKTGQPSCRFNPVTSCYGCRRFMPVADSFAHQEAIAGMRDQVKVYLSDGTAENSPAFMQLAAAISGAQQALELAKNIGRRGHE